MNNHTTIWGSWYDTASGLWGYACCHSDIHVSYCSGQAGIDAAQASSAQNLLKTSNPDPHEPPKEITEAPDNAEDRRRQAQIAYSKERLGEGELKLNEERLAEAVREEKKRKARGDDTGDRKRKKGEDSVSVSEEQMEAYRMNRHRAEDPMANYIDEDL
jgi:pre-mRNA-processing factor SLU7